MINLCHFAHLIQKQAEKYGDKTALSFRDYDKGVWVPISWNEFAERVNVVSNAFISMGVRVQENIGVFSQNMPEDLIVDFGAYGVRAVTIPLYPTSSQMQVKDMVNDAGIRILFVGEQSQYDIAFHIISLSNSLEKIVIFDSKVVRHPSDRISISFDEFLEMGKPKKAQDEVNRRKALAVADDVANILYTSGTAGQAKGVMMTHKMYLTSLKSHDKILPMSEKDIFLNFLPFTHVFERGCTYLGLAEGCQMAINLRPADVMQSLKEVHPTCMCTVPRFWEKIYENVQEYVFQLPPEKQEAYRNAMEIGRQYQFDYIRKGLEPPRELAEAYHALENTIMYTLKQNLGLDKGNFFPLGGASISKEVESFVRICNIKLSIGYGLTESTATVSCNGIGRPYSVGSVGHILDCVKVKIAPDGEILLQGDTVTPGYYHNAKETHQAIDDEGWFHTGDAGYLEGDELFLTERIKDLYKTSNGKFIAPQKLEARLIVDKYIDQIMIIADQQKFVSALIVPAYPALKEYAVAHGLEQTDVLSLCKNDEIQAFLMERIQTLQQDLARYEQVKRFKLLPDPFTVERDEMTSTLKLKRKSIAEHYRKEIKELYK